jgi:large conductance mechanosensitive channel
MLKEFREFILRGNVVDLAVAVVIGAAFASVVDSLVEDIITPLLGVFGVPDFSTWTVQIGDALMRPGVFLNAIIAFLLVALAIFFLVVKPMNAVNKKMTSGADEEEEATEVDLLSDILDELKRSNPHNPTQG